MTTTYLGYLRVNALSRLDTWTLTYEQYILLADHWRKVFLASIPTI